MREPFHPAPSLETGFKMAFTSLDKGGGRGGEQSQIVELSWVHGETAPWCSVGLRMLAYSQVWA